jgi:hypothetical protein
MFLTSLLFCNISLSCIYIIPNFFTNIKPIGFVDSSAFGTAADRYMSLFLKLYHKLKPKSNCLAKFARKETFTRTNICSVQLTRTYPSKTKLEGSVFKLEAYACSTDRPSMASEFRDRGE